MWDLGPIAYRIWSVCIRYITKYSIFKRTTKTHRSDYTIFWRRPILRVKYWYFTGLWSIPCKVWCIYMIIDYKNLIVEVIETYVLCLMSDACCCPSYAHKRQKSKVYSEFGRILDRNAQRNSAFRFTTLSIIYLSGILHIVSYHLQRCSINACLAASL